MAWLYAPGVEDLTAFPGKDKLGHEQIHIRPADDQGKARVPVPQKNDDSEGGCEKTEGDDKKNRDSHEAVRDQKTEAGEKESVGIPEFKLEGRKCWLPSYASSCPDTKRCSEALRNLRDNVRKEVRMGVDDGKLRGSSRLQKIVQELPCQARQHHPKSSDLASALGELAWNWASSSCSEMPTGLSVTLNTKPMLPQSWRRALKTKPWMMLLSGMTLKPSILNRGVEKFLSSLGAGLANLSRQPAEERVRTTLAIYGRGSRQFSEPSGQLLLFSRTSPDTYIWDSGKSTRSFKLWVTQLRQDSSARQSAGRVTRERGSSSWPTARAEEREQYNSQGKGEALSRKAAHWPTPQTNPEAPNLNSNQVNNPASLGKASKSWATPTKSVAKGGVPQDSKNKRDLRLDVTHWPTPAGRDYKGANSAAHCRGEGPGAKHMGQLANFVIHTPSFPSSLLGPPTEKDGSSSSGDGPNSLQQWGTPRVTTNKGIGTNPEGEKSRLEDQALKKTGRKKLNPLFVCWLMNWPIGWASAQGSLGSSEMESYLSRQRALLSRLLEL